MALTNNGYYVNGRVEERYDAINTLITALKEVNISVEEIKQQLIERYHLTASLADRFLQGTVSLKDYKSITEK